MPSRRVAFALAEFGLGSRRVLDLGCGPGEALEHFGPGSMGLDLYPWQATERGLDARGWSFTEDFPDDLADSFDAVWASNIIEHVASPHEFLIRIRKVLNPNGQLIVVVPRTNFIGRGAWRGYLAADHINFFTPKTLDIAIERAGYTIDFLGSPSLPSAPRLVASALSYVGPILCCAGTPIRDFQYPDNAFKRLSGTTITWGNPGMEARTSSLQD